MSAKATIYVICAILFGLGAIFLLEGEFLATLVCWGCTGWLLIWDSRRQVSKFKKRFEKFRLRYSSDELCVSNQNPNLIYQVLDKTSDEIEIQVVWAGKEPVHNGKVMRVSQNAVRPFNDQTSIYMP